MFVYWIAERGSVDDEKDTSLKSGTEREKTLQNEGSGHKTLLA